MLYIIVDDKSGILSSIYRILWSAKYKIISNKFGERAIDGKAFVKIVFEHGRLPLSNALKRALLNINGCLDILYEEPIQKGNKSVSKQQDSTRLTEVQREVRVIVRQVTHMFHEFDSLEESFAKCVENQNPLSCLYSLGFKIGGAVYDNEYALGKPLKLELALKRMLSCAIKEFGVIDQYDQTISIKDNIFCNTVDIGGNCDFTYGFMVGFLKGSPKTNEVHVENRGCRSHGGNACSFEFY